MVRRWFLFSSRGGFLFILLMGHPGPIFATHNSPITFSGSTTVTESTDLGLLATGGSGQLTINSGVTVTRPPGGYDAGGTAIDLQGFNYTVTNRGTIGGYDAFWDCIGGIATFGCFISLKFVEGENTRGINFDGDGSVENFGTLTATSTGIDIAGNGSVINQGSIISRITGIRITGNATIVNGGIIQSGVGSNAIETGTGDDSITLLRGSDVRGPIVTQDGNDTLILGSDSISFKTVNLGLGTNTLGLKNSGTLSHTTFNKISNVQNLIMNGDEWSLGFSADFSDIHIQNGILSTEFSLTGPVTIDATGSFITSNILIGDVLNNGFFTTSSTVTGNFSNNGTLINGDSLGTLTINGNYTHGTAGNLVINFDGNSSDVLRVDGTATLNGGTVSFIPSGLVVSSSTFTFLTSMGLSGNFDTVVSPLLFNTTVSQVGNDLNVTATRTATYQSLASTDTQQKIAAALDTSLATASGDLASVILEMDQLESATEIQGALDQMNPEPSSTLAPSTFAISQLYNASIAGRLNSLRAGTPAIASAPANFPLLALNSDNPQLLAQSFSGTGLDEQSPSQRTEGWNGFFRTFGSTSTLDSEANHVGFDANTFGIMLGGDKWTSNRWIVGGNLGFSFTGQEFNQSNWDSDISSLRLAGYTGFTGEHWYWNGILSYAYNQYSSQRSVKVGGFNRIAEGDHGGHELSIYNSAGYKFSKNQWSYGPIASLQYISLMEESFEEEGAGTAGLKFDSINTNSLRSTAGAYVNRTFTFGNGMRLIPEARAQWAHEWLDTEFTATAQFLGGAGGSFEIQGRDLGTDSVFAGAGVTAYWSDRFVTALNYNIDTGRNGFTSQMFDLRLSYKF